MDLFDRIFSDKEDESLIPLRVQAGENFQKIINAMGLNSFRIQVGDDDGNYTDKLFLITKQSNNPDINGFVHNSLTKSHTSKNLMSIGFNQVIIIIEDGKGQAQYIDLKKYAQ